MRSLELQPPPVMLRLAAWLIARRYRRQAHPSNV
jgi:hypothetical protein